MKKKITLKSIARELDVSVSTVSKALKNSTEISLDTREKIQAFAKLYNYRPNNIAISLKNRHTKNIGVIIPDIVHHFFTTVFRGIEKYANAKGYNVIVCISDESFDKEVINMQLLANGSIDGYIMSLAAETQKKGDYAHLMGVVEQGIPLVLFDRVTDQVQCDRITINDEEAGYLATKKLIEGGSTNIALVMNENYLYVDAQRAHGYYRALQEAGLAVNESMVLRLPYQFEDEEISADFFGKNSADGVLCVNEVFAVRCMKQLQLLGRSIPEDVAIIGFTNGILSQLANPPLTSVIQHGERMGELAAQFLIERVEHQLNEEPRPFRSEVLEADLIERNSTR
ncbi:MAG: LacI family DNA-binding transcriptional regulator [Eudoraea sp.]|nr:LacI family DNA-binding transcriptional regulator [Eudoraea sp.]